jgi:hypothetical protein
MLNICAYIFCYFECNCVLNFDYLSMQYENGTVCFALNVRKLLLLLYNTYANLNKHAFKD